MSDDIQVLDYSNSPAGSRNSPAPNRTVSNKSPIVSKPSTPAPSHVNPSSHTAAAPDQSLSVHSQSKYAALLTVIDELGRDIRPTYAGNKLAAERLKRGIVHARVLARECMSETDRMSRAAHN